MIDFWIERIQQLTNVKTNRCIRIPPFCIDYYDLTFVLEGRMVYYINGIQHILKKNDAIFLPASTLRERDYDDIQVRYVSYTSKEKKLNCLSICEESSMRKFGIC